MIYILLTACQSDTTTKVFNSSPEVTITSHSDGSVFSEGEEVTLRAQATDGNHTNEELSLAWYAGETLLCDWSAPNALGEHACTTSSILPEYENIRVQVRDPEGAAGMAEIAISVEATDAPTVEILSPSATDSLYSDQLIIVQGTVSDSEDTPDALSISIESSVDGTLPNTVTAGSDGFFETAVYLTEGNHFLQIFVEDSTGKQGSDGISVQVSGQNNPPNCEIVSPETDSSGVLGSSVTFVATVSDSEIPSDQLSIEWTSDKDGPLGSTIPTTSGEAILPYSGLSNNIHLITLQVSDETGETCTDAIVYTVGTPPTITLTGPSESVYTLGESITFGAEISDNEDSADLLLLEWSSDQDGSFSTQGASTDGLVQFGYANLSSGPHNITVRATDSAGLTASAYTSLLVNTPPSEPTLSLSPSSPTTDSDLIVIASGSTDSDGHSLTYEYAWSQNGILTSHTSNTVPASDTSKGELWSVLVSANDGYTSSASVQMSTTIANTPPTMGSVTISPGPAVSIHDTLTCSASVTDPDETPTTTYEWENTTTGLSLGSGSTLSLSNVIASPEDILTCVVTTTDSDNESAAGSAMVQVYNSAPTISAINITPSAPQQGDTLTCSASTSDPDGGSITEDYAWSNATTGANLGSGLTLVLSASNSATGDEIVCSVTATDVDGESTTDTSSVIVTNSSPVVSMVSITPSSAGVEETLTCLVSGSDPDGDTLTESYEWQDAQGNVLGSGSSFYLDPTLISRGELVQCVGTLSDPSGATGNDSTSITLGNAPPTLSSISITPSNAGINDTVVCAASSTDPDGDTLTESYVWTDASGQTLGNSASLDLATFSLAKGDSLTCTGSIDDGNGGSDSAMGSIVLSNSLPVISSVTITPSSAQTNDTISLSTVVVSDPDGDTITESYDWTVNGSSVGATGTSLDGTYFSKGDVVAVSVTAFDGSDSSIAVSSNEVTILNTVPEAPIVSVDPERPSDDDDLLCLIDTPSTDADGDTVSYAFSWTVDGIAYTGAITTNYTNDTVPYTDTSNGETWECTVTPSDGDAGTAAQASAKLGGGNRFDGTVGSTWSTRSYVPNGGYSLMTYRPEEEEYIWHAYGSNLQYYDISSNTWSTVSSSTPYSEPWNSMAWYDEDLWMIRNGAIYQYDIAGDSWSTVASYSGGDDMNQTDSDYEGNIYGYAANGDMIIYNVYSGTVTQHNTGLGSEFETRMAYDPTDNAVFFGAYHTPNLYRFDLDTYAVTEMASIPESQLNDIFCGDRSGHIYAAGNTSGTTIFQYDVATNSWSSIPDYPVDHGNNGSCTVSEDGYLYVSNGGNQDFHRISLGMY